MGDVIAIGRPIGDKGARLVDLEFDEAKGKFVRPEGIGARKLKRDGLKMKVSNVQVRPDDKAEYLYILAYEVDFNTLAVDSDSVETELLTHATSDIVVQIATYIRKLMKDADDHDQVAEDIQERVFTVADLENELDKSGRGPIDPKKSAVRSLAKMDKAEAVALLVSELIRQTGMSKEAAAQVIAATKATGEDE